MTDSRFRDLEARANRFAELLSRDLPPHECGKLMGLTKGQTSSTWRRIKADLGAQAQ